MSFRTQYDWVLMPILFVCLQTQNYFYINWSFSSTEMTGPRQVSQCQQCHFSKTAPASGSIVWPVIICFWQRLAQWPSLGQLACIQTLRLILTLLFTITIRFQHTTILMCWTFSGEKGPEGLAVVCRFTSDPIHKMMLQYQLLGHTLTLSVRTSQVAKPIS